MIHPLVTNVELPDRQGSTIVPVVVYTATAFVRGADNLHKYVNVVVSK